jgi:acyl-CoA thioester hydrolase
MTVDPFVMEQRVRPRHCDAQAMVHAARYHDFCEDAFLGWLEYVGIPYAALRAAGVDLVISESRFCYRRPARLDDPLRVAVTGETVAESTLKACFDIRCRHNTLATAEITYVALHEGRRCDLPAIVPRRHTAQPVLDRTATAESLLDSLHRAQADL